VDFVVRLFQLQFDLDSIGSATHLYPSEEQMVVKAQLEFSKTITWCLYTLFNLNHG